MKKSALLSLAFATLANFAFAESEPEAPNTPSFTSDKAITLQGTIEAADRYGQADFNIFNAGNGYKGAENDDGYMQGANVTLMGIAVFDLEANDMAKVLANPESLRIILSFAVMQVEGKPRPLTVEYVGTFDDLAQSDSLSKVFEATPLLTFNNVMSRSDKNGIKMVDVTPLSEKSLNNGRWLVMRFQQQGLRIENTGQNDLYQMNPDAGTIRLTLSEKGAHGQTVAGHYNASGYYSLTTDMPNNLLGDMPKGSIEDNQSNNLTSDMPSDLTSDMPSNLITDEPSNLIQDGNN